MSYKVLFDANESGIIQVVGLGMFVPIEKFNALGDERDAAWAELREIRSAINANPEESTADEVRRVVAERDDIKRQNAELMAQIETLRSVTVYQFREIGEGDWADCDESWFKHCQKSPIHDTRIRQQCLREVQADAGRAGFIRGIKLRQLGPCNDWDLAADQYAEGIRQGEVK